MKQQEYIINGKSFAVEIISFDGQSAQVRVNNATYQVEVATQETAAPKPAAPAPAAPATPAPAAAPPPAPAPEMAPMAASEGQVVSPMPGVILKVLVKEGQAVTAGETLMILEAMKMENELRAPKDGVVARLFIQPGQDVETGMVLAEIE